MTEKQISVQERQVAASEPSLMQMMARLSEKGDDGSIAALRELVQLKIASDNHQLKMDAVAAEREFNSDFVSMKKEMPVIEATQSIMDGVKVRSRYAGKAEVLRQARPTMSKWGFSESFNSRAENGLIIGICVLRHRGGFSVASEFGVPSNTKTPGTNESQSAMACLEYATKGALFTALGIAVDKLVDADPRMLGTTITPEQAQDLERRCEALGKSKDKLLKLAKASTFDTINDAGYARCDAALRGYEKDAQRMSPGAARCDEEGNLI
jgi:hypothetical protein